MLQAPVEHVTNTGQEGSDSKRQFGVKNVRSTTALTIKKYSGYYTYQPPYVT
jgi:hypothetical protein